MIYATRIQKGTPLAPAALANTKTSSLSSGLISAKRRSRRPRFDTSPLYAGYISCDVLYCGSQAQPGGGAAARNTLRTESGVECKFAAGTPDSVRAGPRGTEG